MRKLLSRKQVLELVPVSRTTLSRWMAQRKFPKPTYIGDGNKAWQKAFWIEDEVERWIVIHTADKSILADYTPEQEPLLLEYQGS